MMEWAKRRKFFWSLVIAVPGVIIAGIIVFNVMNKESTCADGKQNGTETGIDCGGSCALVCKEETSPLSVKWARAFLIQDRVYSAVALIENRNPNTSIMELPYRFRLRDSENRLIAEKEGVAYIAPRGTTAIFSSGIRGSQSREVFEAEIEFDEKPNWLFIPTETLDSVLLKVDDMLISLKSNNVVLSAKISNESLYDLRDTQVVAILFDSNGNALSASRTFVAVLKAGSESEIFFTWPNDGGLSDSVARFEILPEINYFKIEDLKISG